jgi:hypothetical protein
MTGLIWIANLSLYFIQGNHIYCTASNIYCHKKYTAGKVAPTSCRTSLYTIFSFTFKLKKIAEPAELTRRKNSQIWITEKKHQRQTHCKKINIRDKYC